MQKPVIGTEWRERLIDAIDRSGKTRKDIAIDAGLGRAYLYGVINEGKSPSVENMLKICKAIGVSPSYIMFGWNISPKQQELLDLAQQHPDQLEALLAILRSKTS
jgi:transcriptional regulator with XRE-family HTH domain